jgi:hypothetical protein
MHKITESETFMKQELVSVILTCIHTYLYKLLEILLKLHIYRRFLRKERMIPSTDKYLFYVSNQRDAVLSSLFIGLQNHSTFFGCRSRPSSGVHKTVVTTTGTSHVYR